MTEIKNLRNQILQVVLPVAVGSTPADTFLAPAGSILTQQNFPIDDNLRKLLGGNTGKALLGVEAPAKLPEGNLLQALKVNTFNIAAAIMATDPTAIQVDNAGLTEGEVWELQALAITDWLKQESVETVTAEASASADLPTNEAEQGIVAEQSLEEAVQESPATEQAATAVQEELKEMGIVASSPGAALLIADALTNQKNVNDASIALAQSAGSDLTEIETKLTSLKQKLGAIDAINTKASAGVDQILEQYKLQLPTTAEEPTEAPAAQPEEASAQ